MNKKGLTLIELLAVIVILGILALILTPVIQTIISNTRKQAFKESVNGVIESANNYVGKYLIDHNDPLSSYPVVFTCNGTECTNGEYVLSFKGQTPISGNVILDSESIIRAELISNGEWCGSGTKGNVEVYESCTLLDHTNPVIDESKVGDIAISSTTNSVIVYIPSDLMYDDETGIKEYEITIYEEDNKIATKTYQDPNVVFEGLKNGTEYKVTITAINGNNGRTSIDKMIETLDMANPSITYTNDPSTNVNGYYKSQTLNIEYVGTNVENPEYYLRSTRNAKANVIASCGNGDEPTNCEDVTLEEIEENVWYKVSGNTSVLYDVDADSESSLTALMYDGVNYSGANTKAVAMIDTIEPSVSTSVSGKEITITKSDEESGVASYCITITDSSDDCTWTPDTESSVTYTATAAGTYYVFVKDGVGNISISSSNTSVEIPVSVFCTYTINQVVKSATTAGTQTYTVPSGCTGTYSIQISGAQGGTFGSNAGGNGTIVTSEFTLNGDDVITVYIGGQGRSGGNNTGGTTNDSSVGANGGDATYVYLNRNGTNSLIMVAGGGGGASSGAAGGNADEYVSSSSLTSLTGETGVAGGGGGIQDGNYGNAGSSSSQTGTYTVTAHSITSSGSVSFPKFEGYYQLWFDQDFVADGITYRAGVKYNRHARGYFGCHFLVVDDRAGNVIFRKGQDSSGTNEVDGLCADEVSNPKVEPYFGLYSTASGGLSNIGKTVTQSFTGYMTITNYTASYGGGSWICDTSIVNHTTATYSTTKTGNGSLSISFKSLAE